MFFFYRDMSSSVCGPCLEGGNKNLPVNWCINCEELLCAGCVSHHKTLKLTKNHNLTEIKPTQNPGKELTSNKTCTHHPSQEVELYCGIHGVLLCHECTKTYHYSCYRDIVPIEVAANGTKDSVQFINCRSEMANIIQSFSNIVENKKKVEKDFADEVASARNKITEIKSGLMKYIDQMAENVLMDVYKVEKEVIDRLLMEKSSACESQKEAEQIYSEIFSAGSDKEAFILLQKVKLFRTINEQKIKDLSYNMQSYSLQADLLDPALIPEMVHLEFGKVSTQSTPFNVKLTQDLKISVSCFEPGEPLNHDKFLQCMALTEDGYILIAELNVVSSSRVYLFNHEGQQISYVKISGLPTDIAAIPNGTQAVVLADEDKLLFLNMKEAHEINKMNMAKGCNCVSASYSYIFIGYKNEIIVMDCSGKYLQTLTVHDSPIQCIHAEKNGDLFYSIEDNVYHRKQLGEETCLYNSKDLRAVTGIDLDIEGNIYICGRKSHNIHVLKKSSGLAEVVMKKEHGIEKPRGIYINKFTNTMFIQRSGIKSIQVYHFQ